MEEEEISLSSIRELLAEARAERAPKLRRSGLNSRSAASIYGKGKRRKVSRLLSKTQVHVSTPPRIDRETIQLKAKLLPYIDNIAFIDETIKNDERYSAEGNTRQKYSLHIDSNAEKLERLQKKYPRFCSHLNFSALQEVKRKSDLWIARFIEECYDYATASYTHYCTINSTMIAQRQNALALADVFPVLVSKFIVNKYSALRIRDSISADVLFTIELLMERTHIYSSVLEAGGDKAELQLKGDRLVIFSNLLSESWDNDALCMFLNARQCVQELYSLHLKDHAVPHIWREQGTLVAIEDDALMSLTDDMSPAKRKRATKASKRIPLQLPDCFDFVQDLVLPEAPLLAIEAAQIYNILHVLSLKGDMNAFVERSIVDRVHLQLTHWSRFHPGAGLPLPRHDFRGIQQGDKALVPVYTCFLAMTEVWLGLPYDVKNALNKKGEMSLHLSILNSVYDDNCKMIRDHQQAEVQSERLVAAHDSEILKAELLKKKLERRWNDGQATEQEMHQLRAVRVDITRMTVERLGLRSDLLSRRKSLELLQSNTEALWVQVMRGSPYAISTTSVKQQYSSVEASSKWRVNAQRIFVQAVEHSQVISSRLTTAMALALAEDAEEQPVAAVLQTPSYDDRDTPTPDLVLNRVRNLEREIAELSETGVGAIQQLGITLADDDTLLSRLMSKDYSTDDLLEALVQKDRVRLLSEESAKLAASTTSTVVASAYIRATSRLTEALHAESAAAMQLALEQMDSVAESIVNEYMEELTRFVYRQCRMEASIEARVEAACNRVVASESEDIIMTAAFAVIQRIMHSGQIITRALRRYCSRQQRRIALDEARRLEQLATIHRSRTDKLKAIVSLASHARERRILRQVKSDRVSSLLRLFIGKWRSAYDKSRSNRLEAEAVRKKMELLSWQEHQQRVRICATVIQKIIRGFICYRKYTRFRSGRVILRLFRCARAKKLARKVRLILYFREEVSIAVAQQARYLVLLKSFRLWLQTKKKVASLNKLFALVLRRLCKPKIVTWREHAKKLGFSFARKAAAATSIQSVVRMFIVKRTILDFAKWRRALIRMQSCIRRMANAKKFVMLLRMSRACRLIQKRVRGMLVRHHLTDNRIEGMHIAAANNHYEKLKKYVLLFPGLVNAFNKAGDSIMHSAAFGAAKRTIKFLLKLGLDANALNVDGFTPMHRLIQSAAIARDDCFSYVIEHGFDEEILAPNGQTSLLLAVSYGHAFITQQLLEYGANPNQPDYDGNTCLQVGCSYGFIAVVNHLLEASADPNLPGLQGYYPLHYAIDIPERIDICNALLYYGANVNLYNESNYEYPIMTACSRGISDCTELLLNNGANIDVVDLSGWSPVHYAASHLPCDIEIYRLLLAADANFELVDNEGNYPIHIASAYGNSEFMRCLLEGGATVAVQNREGNFPSHVAARYNYVDCLRLICSYETDLGRINYQNQTPIGCANFYGAHEASEYLQSLYDKLAEHPKVKPASLEASIGDWEVEYAGTGERTFIHRITNERRSTPPALSSELLMNRANVIAPYRKKTLLVKEKDAITKNQYVKESAETRRDVSQMISDATAIAVIARVFRRKVAYRKQQKALQLLHWQKVIYRFMTRIPHFITAVKQKRHDRVSRVQAVWRGYYFRKRLHVNGEYERMWYASRKRLLARMIQRMWKRYKLMRLVLQLKAMKGVPTTYAEWQNLILVSSRVRVVGVFEEYRISNVFFYRHTITSVCTFARPAAILAHDMQERADEKEVKVMGYSAVQIALVIRLQALVRGKRVRSFHDQLQRAAAAADSSLEVYLRHPDLDENVFNYALYCHVILNDSVRARSIYLECFRRMESRGPDIPLVLYAYAIFSFVSHEADYSDVRMHVSRGRTAEVNAEVARRRKKGKVIYASGIIDSFRAGKSFDAVNIGFFKRYAEIHNTCTSWHQYAACLYLIYDAFDDAFGAFVRAFELDVHDAHLRKNFDTMMQHYYGNDKETKAEVMRNYMKNHTKYVSK